MPSVGKAGTSSGITTSATGDRHIPASLRADGSTRKEIKIRPGYKPPEDVEVYKNRTAETWKTRGTGGVPGAVTAEADNENKASNTKNAKRREARRRAKAAGESTQDDKSSASIPNANRTDLEEQTSTAAAAKPADAEADILGGETLVTEEPQITDAEAEKEKRARNLKKKLRQARDLREKKDNGESLLPEQFEKVIKINELIRQLDSLGFQMDGEPK